MACVYLKKIVHLFFGNYWKSTTGFCLIDLCREPIKTKTKVNRVKFFWRQVWSIQRICWFRMCFKLHTTREDQRVLCLSRDFPSARMIWLTKMKLTEVVSGLFSWRPILRCPHYYHWKALGGADEEQKIACSSRRQKSFTRSNIRI